MLSPGKWHEQVPRQADENLACRKRLLELARGKKAVQAELARRCRDDIIFYINAFVWQFNPKKKGRAAVGPFITWDFQDEALLARPDTHGKKGGILWCYEHDKTVVVEKSREMGASWLFLIFQDWLCLFHQYSQCLNISKSADAVDHKSPDSLFWKVRFMHEYLPDWLKGPIIQEKMYFGYQRTKSVSTGEASTGRAGVGGRAGVIFIDEFSQIKEDVEVRQRTANTSDCRFFNGTHLGQDTEFYRLTVSPEIVKIQFHWTQHPDKNKGLYRYDPIKQRVESLDPTYHFGDEYHFICDGTPTDGPFPGIRSPWYDRKCQDIGDSRGVAMELDIAPRNSVSTAFDALLIRELVSAFACDAYWEGDLDYNLATGELAREPLVKRPGGKLKLWCDVIQGGIGPGTYAVGCDTSEGRGATNSCLSVGNCLTGDKVLEYADPFLAPEDFAVLAVAVCRLFHNAKLIWETQGPGDRMGSKVIALGYRNIYCGDDEARPPWAKSHRSNRPGWNPTPQSKTTLIGEYRNALKKRECCNRSERALEECLDFRYDHKGFIEWAGFSRTNDPSGAGVNHGDRVIADALMWKMAKELARPLQAKKAEEVPVLSLAWRRKYNEQRQQDLA